MQTANCMVALGGDTRNTVPKYGVTVAEIAVLQAIHGVDAVFDVEPTGDLKVRNLDERERLREIYGRAKDANDNHIFSLLFPGVAARVFEAFDEIQLADEQYKASGRVSAAVAEEEPEAEVEEPEVEVKPAPKAKVKTKASKAEVKAMPEDAAMEDIGSDPEDVLD